MLNEKVNKFIDVYSDELGLDDEIRQYLKELIPNLVSKYEGINVDIRQDNLPTYIINPNNENYSIEDFFINRLFHNVVKVKMEDSLGKHTKGMYVPDSKMIKLNNSKINNQIKFSGYSEGELQEIKAIARKKVIMHEFEHGMQATFSVGRLSVQSEIMRQNIVRKLLEIEGGKYTGEINQDYEKQSLQDDEGNISLGFSRIYGQHLSHRLLLEIFNESECLDMANVTKPQLSLKYQSGNQLYIYNDESSNSSITGYGYVLKDLLGKDETFEGMYFNSEKIMTIFEQRYGDIVKDAYSNLKKGKPNISAMDILEDVLSEIKKTNSETAHLKLNTVLAKCLERNVEITKQFDSEDDLKKRIDSFKKYLIKNEDIEKNDLLEHNEIIRQLEGNIEISEKCTEPELLEQYWKNGIENDFESYIEEVYWEDVLNQLVDMQIGDENVNKIVNEMSGNIRLKKAIVYDLSKKSGRYVDTAKEIPNLNDKISSIDGLLEVIHSSDNFKLNNIRDINNAIKYFEENLVEENDIAKMDFIKDKFNYICELKKKDAILNLSRIYDGKSNDLEDGYLQMQIADFVPPNMYDEIVGKQKIIRCNIDVHQGLQNVFQVSQSELSIITKNEKEKSKELQSRAEKIMKLPPSNSIKSINEIDWDSKWEFEEDEIDEVVKTVKKDDMDEFTKFIKDSMDIEHQPQSVEIPKKEGDYEDYDWD